ncbi:RHS repeat-associated core domain-containing protein [Sorangium sp. So ce1024]|uniref:RHS repeat-associated core domain-containing protein n=1 Tax=unclassified Sorangium TaxID=2621164 RepID=UPI003F04802E
MGPTAPGLVLDQAFAYDADGLLVWTWSGDQGAAQLAFDAAGRVLSKVPEHARREVFSYDAADNLFDRPRTYERGGVLVETADHSYRYDGGKRLVEKRSRTQGGGGAWRYTWDARGLLGAVTKPTGERVENTYDPFARLIEQRVTRPDGSVEATRRFVWDGDDIVHELIQRTDRQGDPVVEERTYAHAPGGLAPLAHRVAEVRAAGRSEQAWVFYLNDAAHRPEALVSEDGLVLARMVGSVWGRVSAAPGARAATPLRFAGQREDEETGLFYNRYRYYDPDTGCYLSPEPLGLYGGLRAFGYTGGDPVTCIDPNGLEGMTATASGGGVSVTRGSATTAPPYWRGAREMGNLHPAVQRALLQPANSLERAPRGLRHPASCAEPRAVSDYLRARGVPDDADPDTIRAALEEMQIGARQADNDRARAPCRNCSQFLANLMALYGAPHPSQIDSGYLSAQGNGQQTNFTPPPEGSVGMWQSYEQARAAYQARTGRAPAGPRAR